DVLISGNTTIATGATVTVEAGASVKVKDGVVITILGILDAQGTSAAKITIDPAASAFGGITVNPGGELRFKYGTMTTGNIPTNGGKTTLVETRLSDASGDFLMMSGGTIDMSYSAVGVEAPATDTTHCDMHFGGTGDVIKVTHSNVSSSSYGIMFYGGMGADFTYDNWFNNTTHVDTETTSPVSGNF